MFAMPSPILFIILMPLAAVFVAQTIKFIIKSFLGPTKEPNWRYIDDYGGMPSAHSALLFSLLTAVILTQGLSSPLVAVVTIILIVIVRDAVGLRNHIGRHAAVLNKLVDRLPADAKKNVPQNLEETIGHTPLQVVVGASIGVALTALAYFWLLA